MSIYELVEELKETLKDFVKTEGELPDTDEVSEIVDSLIPVYNDELLELAIEEPFLATQKPKIFGGNGEETAINAITGNLYDYLMNKASEYLVNLEEETEF